MRSFLASIIKASPKKPMNLIVQIALGALLRLLDSLVRLLGLGIRSGQAGDRLQNRRNPAFILENCLAAEYLVMILTKAAGSDTWPTRRNENRIRSTTCFAINACPK